MRGHAGRSTHVLSATVSLCIYPRRHSRDKMIPALHRFSRTASDRNLRVGPGKEASVLVIY